MAIDQFLAARVRKMLGRRMGLREQRMFGGLGFVIGGHLCVAIWNDGLIARIGPELWPRALAEPHVREFDVTGRSMKGWIVVDALGLVRDEELQRWVNHSLDFVRTLPPREERS